MQCCKGWNQQDYPESSGHRSRIRWTGR